MIAAGAARRADQLPTRLPLTWVSSTSASPSPLSTCTCAHHAMPAGAKVLAANKDARKPHALLDDDPDTFFRNDCKVGLGLAAARYTAAAAWRGLVKRELPHRCSLRPRVPQLRSA